MTASKFRTAFTVLALLALLPLVSPAQEPNKDPKPSPGFAIVRVVVTAGEKDKPVDSASVYFKQKIERRLWKDKKREMNLKTNPEGVVRSPEIEQGLWLIQVIAPGWKTYGKWYEIKEGFQEIQIQLEKPTKWY
jgi:hypothetical protein